MCGGSLASLGTSHRMFSGILVDKAKDLKAASIGLVKAEEELSELWESQSPQ